MAMLLLMSMWAVIYLLDAWESQEISRLFDTGHGYDHWKQFKTLRLSTSWLAMLFTAACWARFLLVRSAHGALRVAVWTLGLWLCLVLFSMSRMATIPG